MRKPNEKPAVKKRQPGKETFPHFRRYKFEEGGKKKKAKHPKLIVERDGGKFGFMGLTESKKRGHHNNFHLRKNPQRGHSEPAYIREELRYDSTENFSKILSDYNLSKEDKKRVLEFAQKLKQKKK